MRIHDLKPRPGAKGRIKRVGCGESSGHGKTSCRGHKGQKARSGGTIRLGFEGGQMPLIRRVPKRGFNNANFHTYYVPVNLKSLNVFEDGATVDEKVLREKRLVTGKCDGVKLLGNGELKKKLTLVVDAVSAGAKSKVEKAGGSIQIVEKKVAEKK